MSNTGRGTHSCSRAAGGQSAPCTTEIVRLSLWHITASDLESLTAVRLRSCRGAVAVQLVVVGAVAASRGLGQPQNHHTSSRRASRPVRSRIAKPTLCPVLWEKKGSANGKTNFRQRVETGLASTYAWLEPVKSEGGGHGPWGEGSREKKNPKPIHRVSLLPPPVQLRKIARLRCEVPANHRQRKAWIG